MGMYEKTDISSAAVNYQGTSTSISITRYESEIDKFVGQYQQFAVKTAQSTLEMCRVVFDAKQSLKKEEFAQFCSNIAHKPEDSTIRKYLAIGEKYQQLITCAELLPNSWTSIYLITQIPAETFNALVATSSDMSSFTGKDIQKLIDGCKTSSTEVDASSSSADISSASADVSADVSHDASADVSDDVSANSSAAFSDLDSATTDIFFNASDASDQGTSSIDHEAYAKKATDQMIDHVSSTISSKDFADDDEQLAYEVIIRFSHRPSDDAINDVVKSLFSIRDKYKLNFEIDTNTIEHG
jgi:hypothetical protein